MIPDLLFHILHNRRHFSEPEAFPGYFVSTDGAVFSTRRRGRGQRPRFAFLAQQPHPRTRHLRVTLRSVGGKRITIGVHRLVLLAFVGDPPEGRGEACHIRPKQPWNNQLHNLYWGSALDNIGDRVEASEEARSWEPNGWRRHLWEGTEGPCPGDQIDLEYGF